MRAKPKVVPVPVPPPTGAEIAGIVEEVLAGDAGAWERLWFVVGRVLATAVWRFEVMSRLWNDEDARGDVYDDVMEGLCGEDFALLRRTRERVACGEAGWVGAIGQIGIFKAKEHRRGHDEYLRGKGGKDGGPRWVLRGKMPAVREDRPVDVTGILTAHRIVAWAEENLPPAQLRGLVLHLDGGVDEDEKEEVTRLAKAATMQLRRKFNPRAGGGESTGACSGSVGSGHYKGCGRRARARGGEPGAPRALACRRRARGERSFSSRGAVV